MGYSRIGGEAEREYVSRHEWCKEFEIPIAGAKIKQTTVNATWVTAVMKFAVLGQARCGSLSKLSAFSLRQSCRKRQIKPCSGIKTQMSSSKSLCVCLFSVLELAPAHLFGFEVFVQEKQGRLVGLGRAHNGKHALARLVVGGLIC